MVRSSDGSNFSPAVLSNRQKSQVPRSKHGWCWKCDRDLVSPGAKCDTCGAFNPKKRFKVNQGNLKGVQ